MNTPTIAIANGLLLTMMLGTGTTAHANEQEGVKCRAGYEATITDGNRHLTCSSPRTFTLGSVCSPLTFSQAGIPLPPNTNIIMQPSGQDTCLAVGVGKSTPSQMTPPLPGYPAASAFQRVVVANGPDRFEAKVIEYAFPERGPVYLGNPSKGVRCASGYDGDVKFDGKGIRCDKNDGPPKTADCDIGWTVDRDRNGKEDRCLGLNEGPTKPQGMTKIQHDFDRALGNVGWLLDKNPGSDRWQRKVYVFPAASN